MVRLHQARVFSMPDAAEHISIPPVRALISIFLPLVLIGDAYAQPGIRAGEGPFVTVDVSGSPFVIGVEDIDFGAGVGYQFDQTVGLSFRMERASAEGDPFVYLPGRTFFGADVSAALGSARAPLRFALLAGVAIEDQSSPARFIDGRTEFRGGVRLYQLNATASAVKYLSIRTGSTRVSVGIGPFAEVRHILPRTATSGTGSPSERVRNYESNTEWPFGILVAVPVAVRLTDEIDLTLEAAMHLDAATSLLGGGGFPHVSVGLDF
ncbi:MAG: hypothetical protein AAF170_12320 [Bacteroidota bacterium]